MNPACAQRAGEVQYDSFKYLPTSLQDILGLAELRPGSCLQLTLTPIQLLSYSCLRKSTSHTGKESKSHTPTSTWVLASNVPTAPESFSVLDTPTTKSKSFRRKSTMHAVVVKRRNSQDAETALPTTESNSSALVVCSPRGLTASPKHNARTQTTQNASPVNKKSRTAFRISKSRSKRSKSVKTTEQVGSDHSQECRALGPLFRALMGRSLTLETNLTSSLSPVMAV